MTITAEHRRAYGLWHMDAGRPSVTSQRAAPQTSHQILALSTASASPVYLK